MDIREPTATDLPELLELTVDTFGPFYEGSFRPVDGDVVFTNRRGVGTALAEHAIAQLMEAGVKVVSVGTGGDSFHAPARALYEQLGFTPSRM